MKEIQHVYIENEKAWKDVTESPSNEEDILHAHQIGSLKTSCVSFSFRNWQVDPKSHMEMQGTQRSQTHLGMVKLEDPHILI
jgi:hypothetical protein